MFKKLDLYNSSYEFIGDFMGFSYTIDGKRQSHWDKLFENDIDFDTSWDHIDQIKRLKK